MNTEPECVNNEAHDLDRGLLFDAVSIRIF